MIHNGIIQWNCRAETFILWLAIVRVQMQKTLYEVSADFLSHIHIKGE